MSEEIVTSVNEMTGAVLLDAEDVKAVPSESEGKPNGVATLDSSGQLPEAQLPTSVVTDGQKNVANGVLGLDEHGRPPATLLLGIADPKAAPYGAKLDGETDDTAAFTRLHEAINAGTIRGYLVYGKARITSNLPILTKTVEILFVNDGELDFSTSTTATQGIALEGGFGEHAALTANAEVGSYVLKVGTAYADGTWLKIDDPETQWDEEQKAHPGEQVQVRVPDGVLSGINGSTNSPGGIKAGEKITSITLAGVNPVKIWPATGTIKVGEEIFTYTAVAEEAKGSLTKFTITEKTAEQSHSQGVRTTLVPEAGTVYLTMPVSHELGYTTATKSRVQPVNSLVQPILDRPRIKGPGAGSSFTGIQAIACDRLEVESPVLIDCYKEGILAFDCTRPRIRDPYYENTRFINFGGASGNGYGTYFGFTTQDGSVTGGRTLRGRHAYTQGSTPSNGTGLPRRNRVIDHTAVGTYADGFDSHGGANDITFIGCTSVQPNNAGFSIHCPKAFVGDSRVTRPSGGGIAAINRTLGSAEYDFDCEVTSPAEPGIAVRSESAAWGSTCKYIRIRGEIDSPAEHGVQIEGSGEGSTINWYQKNIDIDVTVSNGPTSGPYQSVFVASAENLRVRAQGSGVKSNDDIVKLRDVKHFTVELGPNGWAEASTGVACRVLVGTGGAEGGATDGVIYEGPLTDRGSNSTKLEANVTNVTVFPGPDSNVSLGTGAGNQVAEFLGPGKVTTTDLAESAVTSKKIAAEGVENSNIKNETIGTGKIANENVTPPKVKRAPTPSPGEDGTATLGESGVGRKVVVAIKGNGVLTEWEVEHGLNTFALIAGFQEPSGGNPGALQAVSAGFKVQATTANKAKIAFSAAPGVGTIWYVTLLG